MKKTHTAGACATRRAVRALLVLSVLLVGLASPTPAAAQGANPLADLDRGQRRVFANYTRLFCRQFYRYDRDYFVILPNAHDRRENSSGRSYDQAKHDMTEVKQEYRRTALGKKLVEVKYPPPTAEVVASAKLLPAIDVGHYGYVQSVTVVDIVGPNEMIVGGIEFIPQSEVGKSKNTYRKRALQTQRANQNKTFRLIGFPTGDLKAGDTYSGKGKKGLHLAVMSTDKRHNFVLVNYDRLDRVRTSEFPEVLSYVKIKPAEFIDMVRGNREQLKADGDKASLIALYKRFYSRYRPRPEKRTSDGPAFRPEPKPEDKPRDQPEERDPPEPGDKPRDRPGSLDEVNPPAEDKPEPPEERDPPRQRDEPEQDDDWEYDESEAPDGPSFFGIPL